MLARRAGTHAASPLLIGALACGAALLALLVIAGPATVRLRATIANACNLRPTLTPDSVGRELLAIGGPLIIAAALTALVAHLVQTRTAWLPRRRVPGAPYVPRARIGRAAFELASAAAVAAIATAWLWQHVEDVAGATSLSAAARLVMRLAMVLVIAWVALGIGDALARNLLLGRALMMTDAERREDERLAAADPRWRTRRQELAREPSLAGVAVVLVGDDLAIAIAWHASRQPVPSRTEIGRGVHATRLAALARRHGVAVFRDASLATTLGDAEGPVPEAAWPRLADIVAATRR